MPHQDVTARLDDARRQVAELKAKIDAARGRLNTGGLPSVLASLPAPKASLKHVRGMKTPLRHAGRVTSLFWAANGNDVIVASQDGRLSIWNVPDSARNTTLQLRSAWVMTVCLDYRWGRVTWVRVRGTASPLWWTSIRCAARDVYGAFSVADGRVCALLCRHRCWLCW